MQDISQLQSQVAVLAGSFRVRRDLGVAGLTLHAESPDGRIEVHFPGAVQHAIPERIEDPVVLRFSATAEPRAPRLFEIRSARGSWRFEADSVQVHEYPVLFGRAVALPPFRFQQRVLWTSLLWIARFRWGRALIGHMTSRKRPRSAATTR